MFTLFIMPNSQQGSKDSAFVETIDLPSISRHQKLGSRPKYFRFRLIMAGIAVGDVVIPGDKIEFLSSLDESSKVILGPGLKRDLENVIATKSGVLNINDANIYWINSHQKRYIPARGDDVLGIVTNKVGDFFKVDIGCSEQATLSYLAFEGATKRNRPIVKIGDLIFANLLVASSDMEPELVCVNRYGKSEGKGVLDDGFMFQVSVDLIRKIRSPNCKLLSTLGEYLRFESAIGMNGRIWVKTTNIKNTIGICNAMLLAEHMTNEEIVIACQRIVCALEGF